MNNINPKLITEAYGSAEVFRVDGLDIHLDSRYTNISVDLSGGADSAILTYLLLEELKRRNQECMVHIITHRRCSKSKPWQGIIAKSVAFWFKVRYNNIKRHVNFIPESLESVSIEGDNRTVENIIVDEFREHIIDDFDIDMGYNATSLNPPFPTEFGMDNRDREDVDAGDLLDEHDKMCNPLMFTNKAWIIKQYINHDILDLLHRTRSCEGRMKEEEWDGIIPPDCNYCFWCQERHWAMKVNGL